MVIFVCDSCGEILKKNQVDAHAYRCRTCASVSCVDCNVSFFGDDYRGHTSCMTEAERYEKTLFRPKNSKKKKNPQEAWMDLIMSAADNNAPSFLRSHLQRLSSLDNVPRKEKQFRNFTSNSLNLRGRQTEIVTALWSHLSQLREKNSQREKAEQEKIQKAQTREKEEAKESENDVPTETNMVKKDNRPKTLEKPPKDEKQGLTVKSLRKTMKKVLKKAPKKAMKVKDLRTAIRDVMGLNKKSLKKKLKEMLSNELGADSKRVKVDGKLVSLR